MWTRHGTRVLDRPAGELPIVMMEEITTLIAHGPRIIIVEVFTKLYVAIAYVGDARSPATSSVERDVNGVLCFMCMAALIYHLVLCVI